MEARRGRTGSPCGDGARESAREGRERRRVSCAGSMSSREGGDAMQRSKQKEAGPVILRRQREVIRDVMLSAGQCATWLTLDELAKLTHYPPASISAQLRHMRKPRFGAYEVVKRCRKVDK